MRGSLHAGRVPDNIAATYVDLATVELAGGEYSVVSIVNSVRSSQRHDQRVVVARIPAHDAASIAWCFDCDPIRRHRVRRRRRLPLSPRRDVEAAVCSRADHAIRKFLDPYQGRRDRAVRCLIEHDTLQGRSHVGRQGRACPKRRACQHAGAARDFHPSDHQRVWDADTIAMFGVGVHSPVGRNKGITAQGAPTIAPISAVPLVTVPKTA